MKRLVYTIALVIIGITSGNAQETGKRKIEGRESRQKIEGRRFERHEKLTAEERAEKAAQMMQKRLSLSDAQKQKVEQIELERINKHEEWRKQDQRAFKNKMETRKAYMNASKEKIEKILTEEQRQTLANNRTQLKEKVKAQNRKIPGRLHRDRTAPSLPIKN